MDFSVRVVEMCKNCRVKRDKEKTEKQWEPRAVGQTMTESLKTEPGTDTVHPTMHADCE